MVIRNPGPTVRGISHKAVHVSSWCVCVCVCEWGVSRENKCDESMWIIICAAEGAYGWSHRGLVRHVLQSKVMFLLKSIVMLPLCASDLWYELTEPVR